ncbi:CHAT domain-containing protein [Rhodococcus sp. BP-349]|nr:CHAT domain-containing protein [Rhodococcus sp. BP-363]MBY6541989.1 CHAT domain-containing protein [Rhodococcus sp. BP-369]MBY6561219.1 CHAT domain-containing protein [Rhodococcus sp. BP-370]MBY6575511.1 CHAT domain-containing protein [Rhodococcus sp. BP-364]MBY6584812.1 CHAT domain-containing protein [Rhodococcus sp. BP-358]MBY6589149.1 CHAT domain-containing protein [Rhodococcus sp. BP-362]MBY6594318.1 CHAT domain-containing protein [Rhodococcus sp. BP-359]MBY6597825.1 CHAT domain-conta
MSADQIRRELERKIKAREDAETDSGKHRAKASVASAAATKARLDAAKTTSAMTAKSKTSEAERRDKDAMKSSKDAATADAKAASLRKDEARIRTRLATAETSERKAAEQKQKTEDKRVERAHAAERDEYERRIAAAEAVARQAQHDATTSARSLPEPKPEKLRVLLLGADSKGAEAGEEGLRIGREHKRIAAAVRNANHRDLIELQPRPAATTDDLLDGISQFRPHVVHFSGHSNNSILAFEDDEDAPHDGTMVAGTAFARAMQATDEPPTLVVLNSCDSAAHLDALIGGLVPFAVGMTDEIGDSDAIIYAARFYASIANGQSIASAHAAGLVQLEMAGLDPDIVVLRAADDLDAADAFLVSETDS